MFHLSCIFYPDKNVDIDARKVLSAIRGSSPLSSTHFDSSQRRDVCLRGCSPSIFDANKHQRVRGGRGEDKSICCTLQPFEPLAWTTFHRAEKEMDPVTIYISVSSGAGVKCTSSAQETAQFSFFRTSLLSPLVPPSVSSMKVAA